MFEEQLSSDPLPALPAEHRDAARSAIIGVVGDDARVALEPVIGGASGAIVHRLDVEGSASLLLRVETARDGFRDPHRTYPCLRSAADAGVAPAVHVADPESGVVIMDFVQQRPVAEHPGGPIGVVNEIGELLARLQATPAFAPVSDDFATLLGSMLSMIDAAGAFEPGVLAPVHDGLARVGGAYPWGALDEVSSHNDVNPYNLLYDGSRLWLVDWELAFGNDPLADVACAANNFGDPVAHQHPPAEIDEVVLRAWLGRDPDAVSLARLGVMRQLNRLFYGCLMLSTTLGQMPTERDLDALTPEAFGAELAAGRLALGSPGLLHAMGKMQLAGFLEGIGADGFDDTLRAAAG